MTQEEPKENKLFDSIEQLSKIAQDLVRRKTELAQPKQKPVAFLDWYKNAIWGNEDFQTGCHRAWTAALKHTTPPQRTWVGLTDEEIQECYSEAYKIVQGRRLENAFYKTIEAKLKERNT